MGLLLLFTGEPVLHVPFGGDAAEHHPVTVTQAGVPVVGPVLHVESGGDASATFPVTIWVAGVPAGADPEERVRVWHFASPAALHAGAGTELEASHGRGWVQVLSAAGSFTAALQNDDEHADDIDYGDYVRVDVDGQAVMVGVVEQIDRELIAPGEEHDQITTVAGRGAVADWERAIVEPATPPGSSLWGDTRHFGWASPELVTDWPTAWRQWQQRSTEPGLGGKWGTPLGWPDPDGWWIWSTPRTSTPPLHSPGTSYFRNTFATSSAQREVAIYLAADDAFDAWLDGVPVGGNETLNGWKETYRADVTLTPGEHLLAIRASNFERAPATNTAGLIVAVYALDDSGRDSTLLLRTGHAAWQAQHHPTTPPGFTAGQLLRHLLTEAQAAGHLDGWSLDFDDHADSGGNPWPPGQQFSLPVGTSLLAVLEQLAESHIDYLVDPSALVLRAWRIGEAGVPAARARASLVDGLGALSFEGRG